MRKNNKVSSVRITDVTFTSSEPIETTIFRVDSGVKQVNETIDILNTSSNIETVISRYDFLLTALGRLIEFEHNPAISFPNITPSKMHNQITDERPKVMTAAVQRAHENMIESASKLKTEKGYIGRKQKFFDLLRANISNLPPETCAFIDDLLDDVEIETSTCTLENYRINPYLKFVVTPGFKHSPISHTPTSPPLPKLPWE